MNTLDTVRHWLRPRLLDQIPLSRAMQLDIAELADDRIVLAAPLAPNLNDKGCAFGGSIASLLTLAGWGLISGALHQAGIACGVYIQDSHLRYLKPGWEDLRAEARLDPKALDSFVEQFRAKGKARIEVHSDLHSGEVHAASMAARYVALSN